MDAESGLRDIEDELVIAKCHRYAGEALQLAEWSGRGGPDNRVLLDDESARVAVT